MASTNISVNTENIAKCSEDIKFLVEDIRGYINNATIVINKIESESWKGEGSQQYIETFNNFKQNKLEKMATAFNALATALKANADQISQTQQQIRSRIRNLGAISTSATGALSGNFVNSDTLISDAFNDPNNTFVDHGDGTYQIVRNGTVIGYTTKDNVVGAMDVNSNSQFSDSKIDAYDQRDSGGSSSSEATMTSTDRHNQHMSDLAQKNSQPEATMTSTDRHNQHMSDLTQKNTSLNDNVWADNKNLNLDNPFDLTSKTQTSNVDTSFADIKNYS